VYATTALERLKESFLPFLSYPQPVPSFASKYFITMCSFSDQYSTKDKRLEIVDTPLTDLPNANLRYHVMPLSTIILMISLTVGIDVNTTIKRECHD